VEGKFKNLSTGLLIIFLVVLIFSLDIFAVTVDYYQDCENGNAGNLLTSTIMNGSGHGFGAWSITDSMWVSNNNSRQLPGTVTVDGTTYNDTGNRTWAVNDNMDRNFVTIDVDDGTSHADVNVACYMTPGPIVYVYNNFDNIVISNFYYAVLQFINPGVGGPWIRGHGCDSNWATTITGNIKIEFQKTYWINLYYKGTTEMMYVAVFDPDNGYAQVGNTVSCHTAYQSFNNALNINFGRYDAHGDNLNATTQTTFDDILIDYTDPPFPLLPDLTGSDTTPPIDIATVNDGTSSDMDSTSLTTQLSANWPPSADGESNISKYWYAIGDTPGSTGVVEWTDNGNVTNVTRSSLSLTIGVTYYFTVKAENGVALQSNSTSSDGQCVLSGGTGPGGDEIDAKVYPNPYSPSKGNSMRFSIDGTGGEVKIYTLSGKLVKELLIEAGESGIDWDVLNEEGNSITAGLYIYTITDGAGNKKTGKLAISD
jgi:hypothetical protein